MLELGNPREEGVSPTGVQSQAHADGGSSDSTHRGSPTGSLARKLAGW